ncbi:MAG: 16S rRNA (uracil(1498)-N(3))-methyltransferase [Actinobacteria bacterium]|nr:16S rRNA (uracil(1498)-N(3))-methyltransferase [Actinomycetota bacterium]
MALHRFFAEGPVPDSGALPLDDRAVHHLRDVLRLGTGDEIIVVYAGTAARVRLTDVGVSVRGERMEDLPPVRLPRVTLVQGLAKGEKMDDIVRQATEIGVSRIVSFAAERSVVKLDARKAAERVERWRRIAAEAAQQSQRADIPEVLPLAAARDLPSLLAESAVLVCWEDAAGSPGIGEGLAALAPTDGQDVAVVIGPEGGLTEHEARMLSAEGAVTVSLGETILRTETAGVVSTALAMYLRGGLGARHD